MPAALITGLSGGVLTADERAFFADVRPAGVILFARNCQEPEQVRRLIGDVRSVIGAGETLVLVDQEGGRVQRLRPPHWRELPRAAALADLYAVAPQEALAAARAIAELTAAELLELGFNTNCTPVVDVPSADAHAIIGDRAYGHTPEQVAALARAVAEGHLAQGVLPVVKHMPGHGRAKSDSHLELPVVDASRADLEDMDFAPFRALADMPAAMTAHVVYTSIDASAPASTSPIVTQSIIRDHIGFDGLLMSDDLSMKALSGTIRQRAAAVIAAGSDLALHCNGDLSEMRDAAAGVPELTGRPLLRFQRATALLGSNARLDRGFALAQLSKVLATTA